MTNSTTGTNNTPLQYCSFCKKSQREARKLIAGPKVQICDECVQLCVGILKTALAQEQIEAVEGAPIIPTPKEIRKVFDEFVIGQDMAKRVLAVAAYNHYKRVDLLEEGALNV